MTIIDPAGGFAQARLYAGDRVITLWPGAEGRVVENPEGVAIPMVTSISLELNPGMGGKISVGVATDFEKGLEIFHGPLLQLGNVLAVQFSYPLSGVSMPWFEGMTLKPDFELSSEGFTATLNAEGGTFPARQNSGVDVWARKSYVDIIRLIAARPSNGWTVEIPDRDGDADPLYIPRNQVSQASVSDLTLVGRLARNAGCDISFAEIRDSGHCLRVIRRGHALGLPAIYGFTPRGQCDFETTFPMFSLKPTEGWTLLPPGTARVVYADIHPETGDDIGGEVTPDSLADSEPTLGPGGVAPTAGTPPGAGAPVAVVAPEGVIAHAPAASSARTPAETARAAASHDSFIAGLGLDISSIGLPGILPDDNIKLGGAGIFSGVYRVLGIRHDWTGSWDMSLTLLTNSQGRDGYVAEMLARPNKTSNTSEPTGAPVDGSATVEPEDPAGGG